MLQTHSSVNPVRTGTRILFVAVIYFLLARLSLLLAFEDSNATPVWPPSGFALAMILLAGRMIAPGIAIGAFTANLVVFIANHSCTIPEALTYSLWISIGNTAEALTGYYLLKKLIPTATHGNYFQQANHVFLFALATILMCFTGAVLGTCAVWTAGIVTGAEFPYVWLTWMTGDLSGVLLLTPLILTWTRDAHIHLSRNAVLSTAALFIAVILLSGTIFLDWFFSTVVFNWAFWLIPVMTWAAFRFRKREMITAMVLISVMAIWGTATHRGAFGSIPTNDGLLIVEAFVSIMLVTKLALNASISEHRKTLHSLHDMQVQLETRITERTSQLRQEKEFVETLFQSIEDLMAVFDTSGRYITVNRKTEELYRVKKEDLAGKHILDHFPEAEHSGMYANLQKAIRGETVRDLTYFSKIKDRHFENFFIPLKSNEGGVYGVLVIGHDISEARKMEKKFRGLVESSPDATVFVNREGNIVLVNSQAEKLFGYERKELEGRQVDMLLPSQLQQPSSTPAGTVFSPQGLSVGTIPDLFGRKKDGTEFPAEISLSPIETEDGLWISSSIRDISNRKKAEEEIKNINEQLTEAQRLSHLGNWEWDLRTAKLTWSDEMFSIFGRTRENFELTFDSFIQSVHPDDRQKIQDSIGLTLKKRQPFDFYYRIIRPDGQVRTLQRRGEVLMNEELVPVKLRGTTQDVTEIKQAEELLRSKTEELVVLNHSLHTSNRELERRNADLSTFAYVASHDLQEPIRKIQTFATRILESETEKLSETGRDYLQRMFKSVRRVHALLEDLLTYSRLNTNEKVFEYTDLNKIMEEEKEELKELMAGKKVTFESDLLPHIQAIPFQMRQLFHNLFMNSMKFSDPGRPPHIRIRCTYMVKAELPEGESFGNNEYHRISFADNGIGFEPRYKDRIFEVFQRLHLNNSYPGTGIGLAICKKIAENHGGLIIAEGEPDKGATFHIYLPANNLN